MFGLRLRCLQVRFVLRSPVLIYRLPPSPYECLMTSSSKTPGGREQALSCLLLLGHYFHHKDATFINSNPDYLPKAPSSSSTTLGVRSSTYEFWGDKNIQSLTTTYTFMQTIFTNYIYKILLVSISTLLH